MNKILLVLTNLLTNAIKYKSEEREGNITVEAFKKGKKYSCFCKKIMVREFQRNIKRKYLINLYKLKFLNDGKIEGTGLGLSICKEIIKLMEEKYGLIVF